MALITIITQDVTTRLKLSEALMKEQIILKVCHDALQDDLVFLDRRA